VLDDLWTEDGRYHCRRRQRRAVVEGADDCK
jgi:hypothetical protein